MSRLHLVGVLAVVGLSLGARTSIAADPPKTDEAVEIDELSRGLSTSDSPVRRKIEQALATIVDGEAFEGSPNDLAKFIAEKFQIPVAVDTRALEEGGLAPDSLPIRSFRWQGRSLETALLSGLREYELTIAVVHDQLLITHRYAADDVQNYGETRVYPVKDLVEFSDGAVVEISKFPPDYNTLTGIITGIIGPGLWMQAGGFGAIDADEAGGNLIVRQTREVHRDVARLLATLRTARRPQALDLASETDGLTVRVYALPRMEPLRGTVGGMAGTPRDTNANTGGNAGGLGGGFFAVSDDKPAEKSDEKPISAPTSSASARLVVGGQVVTTVPYPAEILTVEGLARQIPLAIASNTWESAGGKGTIHAIDKALVVRQTPEVHEQVETLLRAVYR